MKKCPFCAEEIQSEAIKCKHCGEWLSGHADNKSTVDHDLPPEIHKEDNAPPVSDTNLTDPLNSNGSNICEKCGIDCSAGESFEGSNACNSCTEQNLKTEVLKFPDDFELQENTTLIKTISKPRKYGWGWLIWLVLCGSYTGKEHTFSDYGFAAITNLICFLMLLFYFPLRKRLINKWEYDRLTPGFAAGACIFLVVSMLSGTMHFIDDASE